MKNRLYSWMTGFAIGGLLLTTLYSQALAGESGTSPFFQDNDPKYVGGRGLITAEGPSGMYLNPTSGTLAKGQFTAQFFSSGLEDNFNNAGYYNALLSYGVTDWFEVGAVGYVRDLDRNTAVLNASGEPVLQPDGQNTTAAGPMARIRILKDEQWWPEFSIGGYASTGHDSLDKATLFGAAYKRFAIKANRLDLSGVNFSEPVSFSLRIGNDAGETNLLVAVKGTGKSKKNKKSKKSKK